MNLKNKSIIVLAVVFGIVVGIGLTAGLNLTPKVSSQPEEPKPSAAFDATGFSNAIVNVAANVGPAVVSIHTEKTEKVSFRRQFNRSPFDDDLFNRFFEDFFGEIPDREFKRQGLGSGVIINDQGFILTNEHVIEDADKITVTLPDGREFKGVLKGTDPRSDLAVVKIDAPDLPFAKLGDSDNVKTGQWVIAIGNPFGNLMPNPEPTVTTGVVSALHRSLPQTQRRDTNLSDLIQTDAAINPGNSGGPLLNLDSEVIGINVALFSTTGGSQGIGFAIPINTAKRIVSSLIEGKEIQYGWIGVSVQNITKSLADYFGLPNTDGALVSKALDDGPAKKAGIKDGDVILTVDGKPIKDVPSLLKNVGNAPIGKAIPIEVLRDKKRMTVSVTVAKRPSFDDNGEIAETKSDGAAEPDETLKKWRGLSVQNIPSELAERLRLDSNAGVIISGVEPNSPAEDIGLRKGDIITGVNNEPVKNIKDFQAAVKKAKGDCLLRTLRGYVVIKEPGA